MGEEQILGAALVNSDEKKDANLSRRQFLTGTLAGGAAGLAVAAGTGVAVWNVVDAERQLALEDAEAEIARLQGLVDLYEDLDRVGLDDILRAGMATVTLPLQAVEAGAEALKTGLEAFENVLVSLEDALPSAREAVQWLENQVSAVAGGIQKLETALGEALEKTADNPVASALRDFAAMVLDNLPFGLGDRIRDVLDGLVQLVTSVDELVLGINARILEPLRDNWFSADDDKGIGAFFVDPLVEHILDPLEAHLEDLVVLADTWQDKLVTPTQQALDERAEVQRAIARYKGQNDLA
jgi:hypothetical protein